MAEQVHSALGEYNSLFPLSFLLLPIVLPSLSTFQLSLSFSGALPRKSSFPMVRAEPVAKQF